MKALGFASRLFISILRWRLIGVSNKKMRAVWDGFLTNTSRWWTTRELSREIGLPQGSFEAEIVELDMAGLVERKKMPDGAYVRRLTVKGKEVLCSIEPAKYDWHHRRWRRAKPDPSPRAA